MTKATGRAGTALRYWQRRAEIGVQDLRNRRRFGADAPLVAEGIEVDPRSVRFAVAYPGFADSGEVRGGDWDLDRTPVDEIDRIAFCREHFVEGRSWAETGAYDELIRRIEARRDDRASVDGCRSVQDVHDRYAALDQLYEEVRAAGALRTRSELGGRTFREQYAVVIHIGRDNEPLFSWHGCHRLAISQILALPAIPAQLGVVHTDAVHAWRERYGRRGGGAR